MIEGYYRFVDQPDAAATTPDNILCPHRERTLQRMRSEPTAPGVQDGTDLNFATRPGCDGLGVIGANQTGAQSLGLHLHSTLAVTPAGLPLSVLSARQAARTSARARVGSTGFRDCVEVARELGPGRVVCPDGPRGFRRLAPCWREKRARPEADLLVRVKGRRRVAGEEHSLLDALRRRARACPCVVALDRMTARPTSSGRQAPRSRPRKSASCGAARRAPSSVAPTGREHRVLPAKSEFEGVLSIGEQRTPDLVAPMRWLLLTVVGADTPEACRRIVEYYARRWRIEDWHRIAQVRLQGRRNSPTGCAERLALRSRRHQPCRRLAHLALMTRLVGDQPDLPPDVLFSELEIQVLKAFAAQHGIDPPETLAAAALLVARIGGHIHRPRGPPPGTKVMWRGTATLAGMCLGYRLAMENQQ